MARAHTCAQINTHKHASILIPAQRESERAREKEREGYERKKERKKEGKKDRKKERKKKESRKEMKECSRPIVAISLAYKAAILAASFTGRNKISMYIPKAAMKSLSTTRSV